MSKYVEKATADHPYGYAKLDSAGKVPVAEIPGGGASTGSVMFLEGEVVEGEPGPPGIRGIDGISGIQGPIGPAVFLEAEVIEGDIGPPGVQGIAGITPDPLEASYAPGSFTVETGRYAVMIRELSLVSTQRATLEGTARLVVMN